MTKPIVYIASAYTKGDPAINVHFQCHTWNRLMSSGLVTPIAPLWSHFQHTMYPRHYKDWIENDKAIIRICDACVRLTAQSLKLDYSQEESSGADDEVRLFQAQGKPVFINIEDLLEWAETWK